MNFCLISFKRWLVGALQVMLMVVIVLATVELAVKLWRIIITPPYLVPGPGNLLDLLGAFLLILIGLELLDTMSAYLRETVISAETAEAVTIVAITAVCRKAIVVDYHATEAPVLLGVGAVIVALALAYYLLRQGARKDGNRPPAQPLPGPPAS